MIELKQWFWVGLLGAVGSVSLSARGAATSATSDSLMWNWVALV